MTTHLAMAPPSIRQAAQTARHVPSRPVRRRPGWRRFGWMPLAPAAVTLAVMLSGITSSSYWGDETATISAVSRPLPRLIAMLGHVDVVHGLYYLLIWPIAQVAGTSELVMRLPSAVAMAAAALGIAAIGRRLSSPLAGLLAGLAFAAEPVVSLWGQDARPYAMTVAAAVLASWLLLPVLERPGAARLAAYAASVALLGYLSLTCLLLVAAHAVTVGRAWRTAPDGGGRRLARRWAVAAAAGCIAVTPVVLLGWEQRHQVSWLETPTMNSADLLAATLGAGTVLSAVLLAAFAAVGTLRAAYPDLGPANERLGWLCLPWLMLPPALMLAVSQLKPLYDPRYVVYCLPPVALLAGAGLAAVRLPVRAGVLALLGLLVLPGQVAARAQAVNGMDLRAAAQVLRAHARPGDPIIYWAGNGAARAQERSWGDGYPSGFSKLRNIGLEQTPAASATLGGLGVPIPVLEQRIGHVSRIWVIETGEDTRPPILPPSQFRPAVAYYPTGVSLTLYQRTTSARPAALAGARRGRPRTAGERPRTMVLGRPADPDPGPAGYRRGVETYLAELNRVSQAVLAVSRQLRTRDALRVIVRSARTLADAKYAALGVPDDRGSFGEFVVAGISAAQQRAIGPLPRQHGMLAALLKASEPVRLADIREDPRFEGWPDAHPEMSGFLGVPVRNGPEIMGIIFVANKTSGEPFTEHDTELLSLFAGHAAIALTNARLHERARELSVLQERGRLARELHDAVSQRLFSIRAHARAASALVARDCQRAAGEIAAVAELGAQAHAELRAVIDGLAPPELDGLAASLRRYAALASRAHGVPVEVRAPDTGELPADVSAAAFRVAQEALHNALRHSGASSVRVSLSRSPRRLTLTVADDGTGFDPSLAPGELGLAPGGLGLASMRERASSAGGVLRVHSAPGDGTEVRLTVPVRGGSS